MSNSIIKVCVPSPHITVPKTQAELLNEVLTNSITKEEYCELFEMPRKEFKSTEPVHILEEIVSMLQEPKYVMSELSTNSGVIIRVNRKSYMLLGDKVVSKLPDKIEYTVLPAWPTVIAVNIKVPKGFYNGLEKYFDLPGVI